MFATSTPCPKDKAFGFGDFLKMTFKQVAKWGTDFVKGFAVGGPVGAIASVCLAHLQGVVIQHAQAQAIAQAFEDTFGPIDAKNVQAFGYADGFVACMGAPLSRERFAEIFRLARAFFAEPQPLVNRGARTPFIPADRSDAWAIDLIGRQLFLVCPSCQSLPFPGVTLAELQKFYRMCTVFAYARGTAVFEHFDALTDRVQQIMDGADVGPAMDLTQALPSAVAPSSAVSTSTPAPGAKSAVLLTPQAPPSRPWLPVALTGAGLLLLKGMLL